MPNKFSRDRLKREQFRLESIIKFGKLTEEEKQEFNRQLQEIRKKLQATQI